MYTGSNPVGTSMILRVFLSRQMPMFPLFFVRSHFQHLFRRFSCDFSVLGFIYLLGVALDYCQSFFPGQTHHWAGRSRFPFFHFSHQGRNNRYHKLL